MSKGIVITIRTRADRFARALLYLEERGYRISSRATLFQILLDIVEVQGPPISEKDALELLRIRGLIGDSGGEKKDIDLEQGIALLKIKEQQKREEEEVDERFKEIRPRKSLDRRGE